MMDEPAGSETAGKRKKEPRRPERIAAEGAGERIPDRPAWSGDAVRVRSRNRPQCDDARCGPVSGFRSCL